MNLTTQVVPAQYTPGRWETVLVIDGELTTFSCSHVHHTPEAAAKCLMQVLERAEGIVNDPTFQQVEVDLGLYEWRTHKQNTWGNFLVNSTRFWLQRDMF